MRHATSAVERQAAEEEGQATKEDEDQPAPLGGRQQRWRGRRITTQQQQTAPIFDLPFRG